MPIDVDFTEVKAPLEELERVRATAAAICTEAMRVANTHLARTDEFKYKARECAELWFGATRSAHDIKSRYRRQLKAAEKERRRLGCAILLARFHEWWCAVWR